MTKRKTIRIYLIIAIPVILVIGWAINKYVLNQTEIPADSPTISAPAASGRGSGGKAIPVTVSLARLEQVLDGIRAVGSLVANEEVDLASETSGKVQTVKFSEGAKVRKGEVLVKVNDDDLQAQLKRYLFQEKTLAEKLERQRLLFEKEAVSRESYDQVQTEYNVLQADIDILKVRISRTEILAPFDGTVGFRYISDGSYIQPNTKIAKLVDFNTLKLEFSIPEKYINLPLIGSTIYFSTEGDSNKKRAEVYAMEPKVDDKTRTIILRAKYNNADGRLRPGMSMRVTIPTSEAADVLMIPTEAIIPAMDSKSVWVVRDGVPVQQIVETGTRLEKDIEVLKGLSKGDSVIVTGLMQLREGAKIKVTN